jgi:S1-C subfamily serine protease
MYSSVSTAISFALLASVVGASFVYASSSYPRLGVSNAVNITPEIAQSIRIDQPFGVLVISVDPGSPAEKGGIKGSTIIDRNGDQVLTDVGDIIVGADGKRIKSAEDLYAILSTKHIGDTIRLTIVRGNSSQDIGIILS